MFSAALLCAMPAEPPANDAQRAFRAARPFEIVAERCSDAALDVNAAHGAALERFGYISKRKASYNPFKQ